ncbi:MAG: POTRA domain-containing protein [Desulfotignum sp.]|nr:POTRA domain-containing protein [Desulfotignum sp.]
MQQCALSRPLIIATGSAFVPDHVEKNVQAVKALMKKNGYVDAQVDITAKPYQGLQTDILIDIEKHVPLKTVNIAFTGNNEFSDTRLRMRMKSYQLPLFFWSKGKRTIQKELETDIKNLVAYYRKKGFAEAAVTHDVQTNADKKANPVDDPDRGRSAVPRLFFRKQRIR